MGFTSSKLKKTRNHPQAPSNTQIAGERKPSTDDNCNAETRVETSGITETIPSPSPTGNKQENTLAEERKSRPLSGTESQELTMQSKGDKSSPRNKSADREDEPVESVSQKRFDHVLRTTSLLVNPDIALKASVHDVARLKMFQALPWTCPISQLLRKLKHIQVLNLSGNYLGPQAFRAVCLAMCSNTRVIVLSLANSKTDTDSAECIGKMLSSNKTLHYLDVSNNSLGKDLFSHCVAPALKENSTLKTLRAKSIGSVDMNVLAMSLEANIGLTELDLSSNGLTDRTALARGLAAALRKADCALHSVCVSQCNMNEEGLKELCEAITVNKSLAELNISANQLGSQKLVAQFLCAVFKHPKMDAFHLNDAKTDNSSLTLDDFPEPSEHLSHLRELSLNSSKLTTELFEFLAQRFHGKLLKLRDVDLGNNPELSLSALDALSKLTSVTDWMSLDALTKLTADSSCHSSVERLWYGMNEVDGISDKLVVERFPNLSYLGLRRAKLNTSTFTQVTTLFSLTGLATINLDGLRMAGTEAIKIICESLAKSHVTALSLGTCSLADSDLSPLCEAIKTGVQLHMLKLSANRITNVLMSELVECLLEHKTHPLSVLDVSDNNIESEGATSLSQLYTTKGHNSNLRSLNISSNCVGKEGLLSLVSVVGKSFPLTTLYLNNQKKNLQENEMDEIFTKLATALGLTVKKTGETIESACSDLPCVADSFIIKLQGLGGQPGFLGNMMHCPAIVTDKSTNQLLSLSLADVLDIAAILKGHNSAECVLSADEWSAITGSGKDGTVPAWLQLADHRTRAVYAFNLAGQASIQKLESLLEMDADCNIQEVVLMKDPVTNANNGIAWILMHDILSVERAVQWFDQGEAKIFGQPFIVSRINVKVDDVKNSELDAKVRQEFERRSRERHAEESAHRDLVHRNTEESWKRHAYRLAHPAYADGRVW